MEATYRSVMCTRCPHFFFPFFCLGAVCYNLRIVTNRIQYIPYNSWSVFHTSIRATSYWGVTGFCPASLQLFLLVDMTFCNSSNIIMVGFLLPPITDPPSPPPPPHPCHPAIPILASLLTKELKTARITIPLLTSLTSITYPQMMQTSPQSQNYPLLHQRKQLSGEDLEARTICDSLQTHAHTKRTTQFNVQETTLYL